jgi:AraC-like DNA-binding protein/mannose-6-phosphate isomerase-like protein (cupin superfamily)
MQDNQTYFYKEMPDANFSVDVFYRVGLKLGESLKLHWHEHLQFYYFVGGRAVLECGQKQFCVTAGSIAVINSNELHYMESLSNDLKFYVIRIDPTFLFSNQVDLVQTKYLAPLSQNLLSFHNLIENDIHVLDCVIRTIEEYNEKALGFELAIKSAIYELIVLLLRGYVDRVFTKDEFKTRTKTLRRFNIIFDEIEKNYNNKITLSELSQIVNISPCHFCRVFKQITGKTATDYINGFRLEKSIALLKQKDLNITEISMCCGFDSVNYFSRLFRKCYRTSPTKFREDYGNRYS